MNKCLTINLLLFSCIQISFTLKHEKPIAEKIWRERCNKHSRVLNDCNWCTCNEQLKYTCKARVCGEVDMFGHFNDAIREINVGMEGHGAWRTEHSSCQPGVHYQRGELLCTCTENGNWPNPTCRDTFRILHPVEMVHNVKDFKNQQCEPTKLYLIGCNVCICPADRIPNPKYCTRNTCSKDDPVFETPRENSLAKDIYAPCSVDKQYKLGCRDCVCLRNNRLLCDNCTDRSLCANKEPGDIFNVDCNLCYCDDNGLMYCSVKRCIKDKISRETIDVNLRSVTAPVIDLDCTPGTKYKKDCNSCYCFQSNGLKKFACTLKLCSKADSLRSCVKGTSYERNCLICSCFVRRNQTMEVCREDAKCKRRSLKNLVSLEGFCDPSTVYKRDCNTCECLPDGQTVRCTTKVCESEAISVDILPFAKDLGHCPAGRSFKIDCNVCFCLSNGDILCTTAKCINNNN